MRKLYLKIVVAIWGVMIVSSVVAVAFIKTTVPAAPEAPGRGPGFDKVLPMLVQRAKMDTAGLGEAALINWFMSDPMVSRIGPFLLVGPDDARLIESNWPGSLDNRAGDGEFSELAFDHDGRDYRLSVLVRRPGQAGIPGPGGFGTPTVWQRTVAILAFRPEFTWLILLIAIPLSVLLSIIIARYLVQPLTSFERAGRSLADGDLSVRIGPRLAKRGDEIAEFAATFDQMAERLEILVRSHKELLRDVSHELRSPLARVHAALSLARQRTRGAVDVELDRIEVEVDRLNNLIGRLLTFARLDARQLESEFAEFDLGELLVDVVADCVIEATAEGKTISMSDPERAMVHGDARMLASCFENIIRNAVRHTPSGTTVSIDLKVLPGTPVQYEVRIRDRGAGVPEADLERIFEPFYKSVSDGDDPASGSGIGLAIAKKAVTIHGGDIAAVNAPGGLVVTVRLPVIGRE